MTPLSSKRGRRDWVRIWSNVIASVLVAFGVWSLVVWALNGPAWAGFGFATVTYYVVLHEGRDRAK